MIYALEHHDRLLTLWREQGLTGISLAHVDFHDDLRGLLIDRRKRTTYPIGALARGEAAPDAGNFLAHAVLEGRIDSIRWIHGPIGGRAWDMGIVRYETDLAALPHRLRQRLSRHPEQPLAFEELLTTDWTGPRPGERLSIDWDCFASNLLDPAGIEQRVSQFLERLGTRIPTDTYVAYSPEYSHPTLPAYKALLRQLAQRFEQQLEWLDPGLAEGRFHPAGVETAAPKNLWPRLILLLRRNGIY